MNSYLEYFLYWIIKLSGVIVRLLPVRVALGVGRVLGLLVYGMSVRRKYQVYVNLKIAFAGIKTLPEIKRIVRKVFENFGQNIIEFLRQPLLTAQTYQKYVSIQGREHLDEALHRGKGCILLAMHYGNWELESLAPAMLGYPYKVLVNQQKKTPRLDALLNSYRQCHGAVAITKEFGLKDLVRSLQNNEVVTLVLDQGGKEGVLVPFFDRHASMSIGAIKLGLKMDVAICPVSISRTDGPFHQIIVHPALSLERTGNMEEDIRRNVRQVTHLMEEHIRERPEEYMWFYKVWKYSNQAVIAILNDGRTGHLRQSQTVSQMLETALREKGIQAQCRTWDIVYRHRFWSRLMSVFSVIANRTLCQGRLGFLSWFLSPESFKQVMSVKADFVISCGSSLAAINYLLANDQQAKAIVILKPGLLSFNRFDLVILPQHDYSAKIKTRTPVVVTQGAPNLITEKYIEGQMQGLLQKFSHLRVRDRLTLGLLVGGDTKHFSLNEQKMRIVIHQLVEAAEELDAEILATTSRRTSERVESLLQRDFKHNSRCQLLILANRMNVPEAVGGILGLADILIVSGDSVSMISEAASSGKPTIVFSLQNMFDFSPEKYKHDRFLDMLHAQGVVLSAQPQDIRRAIYRVAKQKIRLKPLDDQRIIYEGIKKII